MLSKKQIRKLDRMELNYCIAMQKAFKLTSDIVDAWGKRYRIAMQRVLQKQCKH